MSTYYMTSNNNSTFTSDFSSIQNDNTYTKWQNVDDGVRAITLTNSFVFNDISYNTIYLSSNGILGFNSRPYITATTPDISLANNLISFFMPWCDIWTLEPLAIYYKEDISNKTFNVLFSSTYYSARGKIIEVELTLFLAGNSNSGDALFNFGIMNDTNINTLFGFSFGSGNTSNLVTNVNLNLNNQFVAPSSPYITLINNQSILSNKQILISNISLPRPNITNFPNIYKTRQQEEPPFTFTLTDPSSNSSGTFSYTSSVPSVASISGKSVTVHKDGSSNITALQAATSEYRSGSITSTLFVSNICFPAGTLITTDQGIIAIEKINPDIHTIQGKKIIGITQTITSHDFLICFEKHALGNNIPSQKTFMTHGHEVFYNGKMRKAIDFIKISENVYKTKYRGEVLYNVLMENHETMEVNNLLCETLNPENPIAKMYNLLKDYSPEEQKQIAKEYNEYTIKNNKFTSKQLKHLNKCL